MLPFKRGMEKIVDGTDVPIIPVHLDRLWGSIFSFASGKFFWKWPQRIPYPVTVSFGAPLPSNTQRADRPPGHPGTVRRSHRAPQAPRRSAGPPPDPRRPPQLDQLRHGRYHRPYPHLRRSPHRRSVLAGSRQACGRSHAEMVGVLLPSTVAGALANLSLTLHGAVPVNLNFTAGARSHAIRHRTMRHPHRHHLPRLPRQGEDRPAPRHRLHRRPAQVRHAFRQAARLADRAFRPRRVALTRTPHARFRSPASSSPADPPAPPRASCSRTTT